MGVIVEFTVRSNDLPLHEATIEVPSVEIEVTSELAVDGQRPLLYFWASGETLDAFETAMEADETVTDVRTYTDLGDRRLYRVQVADGLDRVSYPVWVEAGGTRLETTAQDGTSWNRFRFPDRESFTEFYEWCRDNDVDISLQALYTETHADGGDTTVLSDDQIETMRVAYERGYFEIPQQTTLEELAAELGVSSQAVSERLHRASAALVERYVFPRDE